MAAADYRLCDVCGAKAFYDANLNYEQGRASEWAKRRAPFRWAGEEQGKPEHDDYLLRLDYLGDWAVICDNCAKTHKTTVVPIESAPAEPKRKDQSLRDLSDEDRFMLKDAIMGLLVDPAWDRAWGALIDEQARKQAEPTDQPIWKRLRDAGFTPRDNRIECDECGKRFTPQFLPIHKCEEQAEPKREPLSEATALIEWPESAKWKNRAAPEGIERSCMGEPKREPLSDERIIEIQRAAYERAAQECDSMAYEPLGLDVNSCIACADSIRALGRQHD